MPLISGQPEKGPPIPLGNAVPGAQLSNTGRGEITSSGIRA